MKRIFNLEEAITYVGGATNLKLLERGGLVKAIPGKGQRRDFDVRDLDCAIDQVKMIGWMELARDHGKN